MSVFSKGWRKITTDALILRWIKGYKIPLNSRPIQGSVFTEPSWSSKERSQIVSQIDMLLTKGAIVKCDPKEGEFLSRIFLIPKSDGSHRLILNLKKLHEYVKTDHFKLEDWRIAKGLITSSCFMSTIDLKDAYHSLSIAMPHRKLLRFLFNGNRYEYTCLPFGLSSAPYVFTKIMKPVMAYLRKRGFISAIYIDDILMIGATFTECRTNVHKTVCF